MEKMIIKRVPLKLSELGKLRNLLLNELFKCKDVQIFIEKKLFDEIKYNYFDFDMEPEDEKESRHYAANIQHCYAFLNKVGRVDGHIAFIENAKGYMQVIKFQDGNFEYVHYINGMGKVIILNEKKEENKENG